MWTKLDDGFADNAKILSLSVSARWLHVAGLVFCGRTLTDGFIRASVVPRLTDFKGCVDVNVDALIYELVVAGLWIPAAGEGYLIHDYLEYNPTRQQWLETARHRAEAGRKGALARWHPNGDGMLPDEDSVVSDEAMANAIAHRIQSSLPRPDPSRPVPARPLRKAGRERKESRAVSTTGARAKNSKRADVGKRHLRRKPRRR